MEQITDRVSQAFRLMNAVPLLLERCFAQLIQADAESAHRVRDFSAEDLLLDPIQEKAY